MIPVQVSFRNMPVSDALESACWKEAEELSRLYDRITSCRIVIEQASRQRETAGYRVRLDMSVPGRDLVVTHVEPQADSRCLNTALHDVFVAARRRLEEFVRGQRWDVRSGAPE